MARKRNEEERSLKQSVKESKIKQKIRKFYILLYCVVLYCVFCYVQGVSSKILEKVSSTPKKNFIIFFDNFMC